MSDAVTKLGGGWAQVEAGTCEASLSEILARGELAGDAICAELKARGFANRGPAYYPAADGKGECIALGNPHDYAIVDVVEGVPQWDLMNYQPGASPVQAPREPEPIDIPELMTKRELDDAVSEIMAHVDAKIEEVKQQIAQAVANAEESGRLIRSVVEPMVPGLAGLFGRK
jgi:hypothetical protein